MFQDEGFLVSSSENKYLDICQGEEGACVLDLGMRFRD
jgi:hypothetical protein